MKSRIRITLFALLTYMVLPTALIGQAVKPQNIYRVTVNSLYEIENGKNTGKSYPIHQLISDSLGRLHTEIDYDWETRYPSNYRWHYFDGPTRMKTEFFHNEKLTKIAQYSYADNKLEELKIFRVSNTDTTLTIKEKYSYDDIGRKIKAVGYTSKGKKGYRAKFIYDSNGNEIERKIKGKKSVPADSILYLKRTLEYDSLNRIVTENITIKKFDEEQATKQILYKYDKKNNVVEKLINNSEGEQIKREEFDYRKDNRVHIRRIYDASNNLIDFRAWRYEIYKTNDRRTRVLE
jgi:hypothetical protein